MKRKTRTLLKLAILSVTAILIVLYYLAVGSQAGNPPVKPNDLTSSLEDQEEVSVTVYNSNIGLVKDLRSIRLRKGLTDLKFADVAARIMPQTVHIKSLSDPSGLEVHEQNYEYDLLTPQKMLDKFVGKEIRVLKDAPRSLLPSSAQTAVLYTG